MAEVAVDLRACTRCAACVILAPTVFEVSKKGTRVVRQPGSPAELTACHAAAGVCPARAITVRVS